MKTKESTDQNLVRLTGVISDRPVVEASASGKLHLRFDVRSLVTSRPYDQNGCARTRDLYTTVLMDFDPALDGTPEYGFRRGDRVRIRGVLRSVRVPVRGGREVWKLCVATLPGRARVERTLFHEDRATVPAAAAA